MPVVGSTVFSTIATLPVSELRCRAMVAVTGDGLVGHRLAQIDQHALRHGEGHIDRRHLVDDRQAARYRPAARNCRPSHWRR